MGVGVGSGWGVRVGVGVMVGVGLGVNVGVQVRVGKGCPMPDERFNPKNTAAVRITTAKPTRMKICFRVRRFTRGATCSTTVGGVISREVSHIKQVLAPSATRAPHTGQWRCA